MSRGVSSSLDWLISINFGSKNGLNPPKSIGISSFSLNKSDCFSKY